MGKVTGTALISVEALEWSVHHFSFLGSFKVGAQFVDGVSERLSQYFTESAIYLVAAYHRRWNLPFVVGAQSVELSVFGELGLQSRYDMTRFLLLETHGEDFKKRSISGFLVSFEDSDGSRQLGDL